ncbi:hypothetical protein ABFG93_09065 [Pseudalkalibacillus hwajinpoensis]|uniref:hypothetical protein n=1 Tax=Guptibacillus hwajinpoensis TaxID=208199 RepID=UPI00325B1DCA
MKMTFKKTILSSALAFSMVITAVVAPQALAVTQPHPDEPLNKPEAKKMLKVQSVEN